MQKKGLDIQNHYQLIRFRWVYVHISGPNFTIQLFSVFAKLIGYTPFCCIALHNYSLIFFKGRTTALTEIKCHQLHSSDLISDFHLNSDHGESSFQRRPDRTAFLVPLILVELRGGWQQLCEVEPSNVASQITSPRLTERWKQDKTFSV